MAGTPLTSEQRSLIFVGSEHPSFDPDRKPLKKRFGKIIQSPEDKLQEMMHHHESSITDRILALTEEWREDHRNDQPAPDTNGNLDPVTTEEIIDELDDMDMGRDPSTGGRYY